MNSVIFALSIVILLAAFLGVIARLFRQPLILAYLLAGLVIGFLGFSQLVDHEVFEIFSSLGVMFLLFLVGLEINYVSLRLVGKKAFIIGVGQIIFTTLLGYLIARNLFNFELLESLYIAIALCFSSTVIIIKLLSDKRDLNSLYGKISVGFLLVQDFVAIVILIFLAGLGVQEISTSIYKAILFMFEGIGFFVLMWFLGRRILPRVFDKIANSIELLFLSSLAWLFLVAVVVSKIGFSLEIAGFLAGLALANSSERFQIAGRISALRDFFILIFFVILGISVANLNLSGLSLPIIVFSLFVLIGNPLIVLIIMGILGYRKRTGFMTGLTVAQISEFSLILMAMGLKLKHVSQEAVALVSTVGLITIALSAYLIIHADFIYRKISRFLSVFERKRIKEFDFPNEIYQKPIVLVGCHRTGENIVRSLNKEDLLIIDFDPEVIKKMKEEGYDVIYGDISDQEIFELANLYQAKLVISTSPHLNDNLTLLSELKPFYPRPKIVLRAENEGDAKILYKEGADYVLLPNFTAGQYFGKTIALDKELEILEELKQHDLSFLK